MTMGYTPRERLRQARVYFIGPQSGPVKIGFTHLLPERLVSIQCGSPIDVSILASAPGTRNDERTLHARFAHLRVRGEWFALDDALRSVIAETKKSGILVSRGDNSWRNVLECIGRNDLRKEFGLSDTAYSNWIKKGIPDARLSDVIKLAEREGISLAGLV